MSKEAREERIDQIIDTIHIAPGNLEHITKTGKINGTLYSELKRVIKAFADERYQGLADRQDNLVKSQREKIKALQSKLDEAKDALEKCLYRAYNSFEPDNQSEWYYKLQDFINHLNKE